MTNLQMVLGGRIDLTIINDELLAALKGSNQINVGSLLLSEKVSLEYKLHLLVGDNKNISADTLQRLLRELGRQGEFEILFRRFNMERFQIYRPTTTR